MVSIKSQEEIERISLELLKQSKALDVYPTPVEKVVQFAELHVDEEVNLSSVNNTLLEKLSSGVDAVLDKIRGILNRDEKTIYLDLTQNANRQNFVKLHEVGHQVLPWQNAVLKYIDNDITLDAQTEEQFEAEANFFASSTLFQNDRFIEEMKQLPLSIESSIHLAKYFGASIHASLRRYVEHNHKRCSLLVLEKISRNGDNPSCYVRNYFQSKSFTEEFGNLEWQQKLGYTWTFVRYYYHGRKMVKNGFIELNTKNGKVMFDYHYFFNSWNAFVLFMPCGEKNKTRKKVVFKIK